MVDCIFCDIISKKAISSAVYEDEIVSVIMTIGPVNPGHVVVIPKVHYAYMADMDEDTGAHLFKITMRTAEAIRKSGVKCEGINLFLADGEAAFQEVFHLHMHVFPRYKGDPFELVADWEVKPTRAVLDRSSQNQGCLRLYSQVSFYRRRNKPRAKHQRFPVSR